MGNDTGNISRRGFISRTATGIVAAGISGLNPAQLAAREKEEKVAKTEKKIITRTLGRTGIEMPIVSMGVMNSSDPAIVKASYEAGIRHFDTAAYYQGGRNEKMVGGVVKELGVRDKVIIATKIFTPDLRSSCKPGEEEQTIMKLIEVSLDRLQMTYVDILYIHNLKETGIASNEAIISAARKIKKQGKARAVGVSTHTKMAEIVSEAVETGAWDVVLTAINFTMADYTELMRAIDKAHDTGVGIIAMKTQVGGRRMPNQKSLERFDSSTIATAALKWVLRNEHITAAIPGYTTYEHMREDFSVAFDLAYTEDERNLLEDNEVVVGMGFCRQCGTCVASCPRGVDIPTLMRTHMYAAQYSNFHHARATLGEISPGEGLAACTGCADCAARCARSVDIAGRIAELKMIYA
jgi:predicted aldo/keto reductase-like oxidoreductase